MKSRPDGEAQIWMNHCDPQSGGFIANKTRYL